MQVLDEAIHEELQTPEVRPVRVTVYLYALRLH